MVEKDFRQALCQSDKVTCYDQTQIHLEIIGKSSDWQIVPINSFGDCRGQSDSGLPETRWESRWLAFFLSCKCRWHQKFVWVHIWPMCKAVWFSTSYYKKTSTNSSLPFVPLFDFHVLIKYDQHFPLLWLPEGCLHELGAPVPTRIPQNHSLIWQKQKSLS
jgi:hypothetical protein